MRDPIDPWDRRVGETSYAYRAFIVYRDLGPGRQIIAVPAADPVFTAPTCRAWAQQHDWTDRAGSWDDHLQRVADDELIAAVKTMRARHVQIAEAVLHKALTSLQEMTPKDMKPREVLAALDFATKLERISRGEPTETTEHRVGAGAGWAPESLWAAIQADPNLADVADRLAKAVESMAPADG